MFRVGMKVVCVDASEPQYGWYGDKPVQGSIYTIRNIGISPSTGQAGFRLFEIRNRICWGQLIEDEFYRTSRFRPIVQRTTDISIFTDMLLPSDEKIGAGA